MRVTIKCTIMLAAITVTGCATQPRPVTDSTTRLQFVGFSVLPPQGNNWYLTRESRYTVGFGKVDLNKYQSATEITHSFLAVSYSDMVAVGVKIDTPERLLKFSEVLLREKNDTGRFRPLKLELNPYRTQETDCVQYDQVVEERDNPRFAGSILTITANGFLCRNTYSPDWFVSAYYTERYIPEKKVDSGKSFERESQIFLKKIVFTPPPKEVGSNRIPSEGRIKCIPDVGCTYE